MKLVAGLVLAASLLAQSALAQDPKDIADCAASLKACEAKGFKYMGHHDGGKKNGFWIDCVGPIAAGKTVEGVTLAKDEAAKCVAAKGKGKKK